MKRKKRERERERERESECERRETKFISYNLRLVDTFQSECFRLQIYEIVLKENYFKQINR